MDSAIEHKPTFAVSPAIVDQVDALHRGRGKDHVDDAVESINGAILNRTAILGATSLDRVMVKVRFPREELTLEVMSQIQARFAEAGWDLKFISAININFDFTVSLTRL